MAFQDMFIAPSPQNVPLQDLTKGMFRNFHSTRLPAGGLWTSKNYIVTQKGPYRRPGLEASLTATGYGYPIKGLVSFWKTDGTQETLIWDKHTLYKAGSKTIDLLDKTIGDTYYTGTISASGTTVTGSGTTWNATNDVLAQDVIVIGSTMAKIISVDSTTQLTVDQDLGTIAASTNYVIYRAWNIASPYSVDSVVTTDENDTPGVLFTDHTRAPRFYDGNTFDDFDSGLTYIAGCCEMFNERVFIGNTIEAGTYKRQYIRWSTIDDHTSFEADAWLDLRYSSGALLRLVKMGPMLVAYFEDAIWIGRPTNMDNPPVVFERIETGGAGLVGMKAVCPWIGGHFLVMTDNIYILSAKGLEPIGTPIVKETVHSTNNLDGVQVTVDPINQRAIFGFPGEEQNIDKIWSYHYRAKSWSYDEVENVSSLDYIGFTSQVTWDNVAETPYSTGVVSGAADQVQITGAGVNWTATNGVAAGDAIFFSTEERVIASLLNATTLNLTASLNTLLSGDTYHIVQAAEDWDTKMNNYESWDGISGGDLKNRYYLGKADGSLSRLSDNEAEDVSGAVSCVLETPDYDYGTPNLEKTATAFSLKIDTFLSSDLEFTLEGSKNRGNTWKSLGTLIVPANEDEGRRTFKLTGSTHRFRLTSNSPVAPYTIMELVIRVAPRGREVHLEAT